MAGITATYLDSDTLTISGTDYTSECHYGRRLLCDCDTDGNKGVTILNSSWSDPLTTVNMLSSDSDSLTSNLISFKFGPGVTTDEYGSISARGIDHDKLTNYTTDEHFTEASIDKYTQTEVDTISGSLSSEIDSDIATHASNADAHHAEVHNHDGDTLQCDGINSDGGAFALTTTQPVTINHGGLYLGVHQTTDGILVMYAAAGLAGGTCYWYVSDTYNDTISRWVGQTYIDDFMIGPSNNTDAFKFKAEGDLYVTSGSMKLEESGYVSFGNNIGSSGYGIRDNAGNMEFKVNNGAWTTMSGITDHGALTGLSDDDHTQYLLDTDFTVYSGTLQTQIDAKGDMNDLSDDITPELGGDLDTGAYTISGTGTIITGDHGTALHEETVNIIYGTDTPPSATDYSEGTIYAKYTA